MSSLKSFLGLACLKFQGRACSLVGFLRTMTLNHNSARTSGFFVHSFAVVGRLRRKTFANVLISRFMKDVNTRKRLLVCLDTVL